MSNKKNIDRIFQEQFKDFEATPNPEIWNGIEERLQKDRRKRRVIPIWWQWGGAAAILALLIALLFGGLFNNKQSFNTNQNPIVIEDQIEKHDTNSEGSTNKDQNSINNSSNSESGLNTDSNNKIVNKNNNNKTLNNSTRNSPNNTPTKLAQNEASNTINSSNLPEQPASTNKTSDDPLSTVAATSNEKKNDTNNKEDIKEEDILGKENIEEAVAALEELEEKDEDENETPEEDALKWAVGPNVSPVYFDAIGSGSPIHSQFENNDKNGDLNISYGIAGSYALSKKLKLRAGVNKVQLGYSTNDIIMFDGVTSAINNSSQEAMSNINFNSNIEGMAFISAQNISFSSAPEVVATNKTASLDQQFGYIEVPLEIEYSLLDKRFGINVIGGLSTLFLDHNEIYAVQDGNTTLIGEASNLNSMSYSANLGLGLTYRASKRFNIVLEPMFKYQIKTFSNTSGQFQPYFIGVNTGFSFKL
ncbi:MAG: hypothetical protein BM564_02055 [Bacteroidetes bacterium MedPE-SWsnd-G2]|nr:MAG: hypothetical protein BM564_02055 [Bacteroidetes bacterium MedPE-SWsnd-G2]